MSTAPLRVDGIDISRYQTYKIDYAALKKAGVKWIVHKVTEGNSGVWQAQYDKRRAEAKKAGIPFGAYHFARAQKPTVADATAEAKWFLSKAKPADGDVCPVLDIETMEGLSTSQIKEWAKAFITECNRQGFKVIVYTNFDLGTARGDSLLWTARYNNSNALPLLKGWDIWQFSNGVYGKPNRVAGAPGPTDLNTMRAGLTVDKLLRKKAVAPVLKSLTTIAKEVIAGKWGSGEARKKKLRAAGYDYTKVQAKVNELLAPPAPKPKVSLTLKLTTANIQNFNPNLPPPQVEADMAKVKPISNLILWQELAEERDFKSLIKVMGNTDWGNTAHGGNECLVSWLRSIGTIVLSQDVVIAKAAPGKFSPKRVAKRLVLSTTVGKVEVINVHFTNGARKMPERVPFWNDCWKNTDKLVEAALKAGRIVIVGGDFNWPTRDITKFHSSMQWVAGGDAGIDGIAVCLPAGVTMEVKGTTVKTALNSDHDARSRTVVLRK